MIKLTLIFKSNTGVPLLYSWNVKGRVQNFFGNDLDDIPEKEALEIAAKVKEHGKDNLQEMRIQNL